MAGTCRGGGGGGDGGASATPYLHWGPSAMGGSSPPWNHLDCDDARDPYSQFARAKLLLIACSMGGDLYRVCAAWSGPSQRVAVVTQPWTQQSSREAAPSHDLGRV